MAEQDDINSMSGSNKNHVKVYILLGQSNMVGRGKVNGNVDGSLSYAVKEKHKYPYLVNEANQWTASPNVRFVRVMGSPMKVFNNEWLTAQGNSNIGPELGIGHGIVGNVDSNNGNNNSVPLQPVLLLKSCIGNRSLGWDLLPPNSPPFEYTDETKQTTWHYAGYKESPQKWIKGTDPIPIRWYAGKQYDGDIQNAKQVLESIETYYPNATEYEIAGFFFWQGDKDRYDAGHASAYEKNLVRFIQQLRIDFDAPNAKFVCATLGQTPIEDDVNAGTEGQILQAQLAVDGSSGKYSEFEGNVATVYSHPLCHGGASNSHYNGNAETFMDIGEAMGLAMAKMNE
eukprot:CAMPEP_0198287336 /NCGR_PEP_ID=MMETSP1449-20131203/6197_1 /TAXON_ID=420275 /ORGANISM="Attheya septentrionalis, Strain CCMP2084" /LENGTH=341 /DNA_ID=CAMNT_0043985281 /DNA_START=127 /DNA_END=1152 /DNA_ORIENTATION=-